MSMSLLDRQIASVRGKLTLGRFLSAMGFAVGWFFAMVLVLVLVDRFFWIDLPHGKIWFWGGLAVTALVAGVLVRLRRPSLHEAAVLIDSTLGLKEKFSTALFARSQGNHHDPFVAAALLDAEQAAGNVVLRGRFPITFPRSAFVAIGSGVAVLLIAWLVPRVDLFGHHAKQALVQKQVADRVAAQEAARQALTSVSALPASVQSQQKVELAKKELQQALDQNLTDPSVLKLTTKKAEDEAEAARREEMKSNPQVAQSMSDKAVFNALNSSTDDQGPVADATQDIANGDFSKAADELQSLPDKFDQMTPQEQSKATEQMKNAADELNKIANDPAPMQAAQQQMKQNGATTQQSQSMAEAAQQAAQQSSRGNKQAQQNLQQMQKQVAQQNSGQKPPTPQQQQQIQKAAQQMQSVANSQSKAQQMARAAQQMVHGMQMAQAQRQGGSQAGKQQANAQTGNSQQSGPLQGGQTPSGQQGGTQQLNASRPDGQAPGGNQPGQTPGAGQGSGQGQSEMQRAAGQMAQTMSQMDQTRSDGQQLASGNQPGNKPGGGNNSGGAKRGPNGKGSEAGPSGGSAAGTTGTGSLNGNPNPKQLTPLAVNKEMVPTQNIPSGRILAKSYVKADPIIGKSTIQLSPEAKSAVKESTDEVSEETVPKDAQQAVKDYFDTVQNNSGK